MTIAPPISSETEVVRRAQDGDRAAFEELYERYLPRIFDYALGMLRNRADAEDVASETFLRAVEGLRELREPEAFKGWLYTVARNAALRIVDARKRAVPVDDHTEDAAALDAAPLPAADELSDMRELFDAAAATLSEKERTVYELSVRHGLGSAEIGRVLGVRPAYAYILVNRLKTSVTEAAEAVALSRVGGTACEGLASVLGGVDPLSSRGRKAVARHARTCEVCAETKQRRASLPAMMQGVAFAQPGREFTRELSHRMDDVWGSFPGGAVAGAGMAAVVGAIAAVFIVAVGLVAGAAQRTIAPHEQFEPRVDLPADIAPLTPPPPSLLPAPETAHVAPQAPVEPSSGAQVSVVNSGNASNDGSSGVTTGTTTTSNTSSSGTGTTYPQDTPPPAPHRGY